MHSGAQLAGRLAGPMLHRIAKSGHFEAIGERSQRGQMPRFPHGPEAYHADADFHGELAFGVEQETGDPTCKFVLLMQLAPGH
jgi:hypothetical protein